MNELFAGTEHYAQMGGPDALIRLEQLGVNKKVHLVEV